MWLYYTCRIRNHQKNRTKKLSVCAFDAFVQDRDTCKQACDIYANWAQRNASFEMWRVTLWRCEMVISGPDQHHGWMAGREVHTNSCSPSHPDFSVSGMMMGKSLFTDPQPIPLLSRSSSSNSILVDTSGMFWTWWDNVLHEACFHYSFSTSYRIFIMYDLF